MRFFVFSLLFVVVAAFRGMPHGSGAAHLRLHDASEMSNGVDLVDVESKARQPFVTPGTTSSLPMSNASAARIELARAVTALAIFWLTLKIRMQEIYEKATKKSETMKPSDMRQEEEIDNSAPSPRE